MPGPAVGPGATWPSRPPPRRGRRVLPETSPVSPPLSGIDQDSHRRLVAVPDEDSASVRQREIGRLTSRRSYPQNCAQPTAFLPMVSYLLSSSSRGCGYCGKASFPQVGPEIFVHRRCGEPGENSSPPVDYFELSTRHPQRSTVCAQLVPRKILEPGEKILTRIGDLSNDHAGCAQKLSTSIHRLCIGPGLFPQVRTQPPGGPGSLSCVPREGCG